jgi:CRP-like cAMP-binding protein
MLPDLNTTDLAAEFRERMNRTGVMRTFDKDEVIYEEGEFLQGRIIMVDDGELMMEKLHGGKYISFGVAKSGELTDLFSPVLGTQSMFTVRARTAGAYIEVQSAKLRPAKAKIGGLVGTTPTATGPATRNLRTSSRGSQDVAWFWYVYALFLVKALRSAVSTAAKSDTSVKADAAEVLLKRKLEFRHDILAHYACSHETKGMHAHGQLAVSESEVGFLGSVFGTDIHSRFGILEVRDIKRDARHVQIITTGHGRHGQTKTRDYKLVTEKEARAAFTCIHEYWQKAREELLSIGQNPDASMAGQGRAGTVDGEEDHGEESHLLADLLKSAAHITCKPNDVILAEGTQNESMFQISQGTVRIEKKIKNADKPIVLAVLHRGEIFGDMAFIDPGKASASVVAHEEGETGEVELVRLDYAVMRGRCQDDSVAAELYKMLATVLAKRLHKILEDNLASGHFSQHRGLP